MNNKLIIVESPSKARTITNYFKKEVDVISSEGHFRDLATSGPFGYGVDVENDFKPTYTIIKGKNKVVTNLKKHAKGKEVLLATDPDREGEAIAYHIAEVLDLDINKENRITFNEITKDAIMDAINNPRTIDQDLVSSQETRRILDRIIGFSLSKLLYTKIKSQSAGRVQSVSLKLITELEEEIEKFIVEEYYLITAKFKDFDASYIIPRNKKLNEEEATTIVDSSNNPFVVTDITKTESKRRPPLPYKTSTLLQDARNKLNMASRRTSMVSQKLYEEGYVTYIRTDSERMSDSFINQTKAYINKEYGKEYVGHLIVKKDKLSQDAHEAIRPTNINNTPNSLKSKLNKDEFRLYELIYERALTSLMKPAVVLNTTVKLDANNNLYETKGIELVFDGFYKAIKTDYKDKILPKLNKGDKLDSLEVLKERKETQPPARYNEASLIKALEENGIGRPSTYSTIIQTLKQRGYVNEEKTRFIPTDQGKLTVKNLDKFFKKIMDIKYTAKMEKDLDEIANGEVKGIELLHTFYDKYTKDYDNAYQKMEKIEPVVTDKLCPLCGSPLVIRKSRRGDEFLGCSAFPKCKHTEPLETDTPKFEPVLTDLDCPLCDGKLVIRMSKKGEKFYGCSNFPKCKYTKSMPKEEKK
ncbi:MAG: type I DNA topoisomerase [Acholeplasmataceae bacterium]